MPNQHARSGPTGTVVRKGDTQITPFEGQEEEFNDRDEQFGQFLKQYTSGYDGYNPSNFMNELRTNNDLFNSVVQGVYNQEMDGVDLDQFYEQRGTTQESHFAKGKQELRKMITEATYSGEDVAQTIGTTLRDLRTSQDLPPIHSAEREILAHSSKFPDLIGEDGELIMDPQSLNDTLVADDDLYREVVNARIDTFHQQLQSKHNTGIFDPSMASNNPEEYTKAFLLFEKYGKQGLSQYVNYFQYSDPEKSYEEQSNTARVAIDFMNRTQTDGESPMDYINNTVNEMDFKPRKPKKSKPAMYNNFTKKFFEQDANADQKYTFNEDDLTGFMNFTRSIFSGEQGDELGDSDLVIETYHKSEFGGQGDEMPSEIFDMVMADDENALRDTGYYDHLLRYASRQLMNETNEDGITYADVFATIQTYSHKNGGYSKNDRGEDQYAINYEEAPFMVKLAMDMMTYRSGMNMFVRQDGDDFVLEPNRLERIQEEQTRSVYNRSFIKKVESTFDDEGNLISERVLDTGFGGIDEDEPMMKRDGNVITEYKLNNSSEDGWGFSGVWNMGALFTHTFHQFLQSEMGMKVLHGKRGQEIAGLVDAVYNGLANGEFKNTGEMTNYVKGRYENARDIAESAPTAMTDSYAQKTGAFGSTFLYYMWGMKKLGRGANKMAGEGLNKFYVNRKMSEAVKSLSVNRSTHNLNSAKRLLKPTRHTAGNDLYNKSDLALRRYADGLTGNRRDVGDYLDYVVGGALYNGTSQFLDPNFDSNYSLLGSGMVDVGMDYLGYDTDIEGWFQNMGDRAWYAPLMRLGTSFIAEEVLGHTLDTVFGLARFGKAGTMRMIGKDYSGLKYDPTTGGYQKVTDMIGEKGSRLEGFSPDYRRFFHSFNKDLSELPRYDYQRSLDMASAGIARTGVTNHYFDDFAPKFISSIKPLVHDLRAQIKSTIEGYEKNFDGVMTPEEIDVTAELMYRQFFADVADGMSEVFPDQRVFNDFMKALRVSDEVEIQRVTNDSGSERMNADEARRIAQKDPNARIQEVEVDGEKVYEVYRFETQDWMAELTGSLRRVARRNEDDGALERFLGSERTGRLEDDAVAKKEFDTHYREEYVYEGKRGKVVGAEGNDFILEDIAGNTRKVPMDEFEMTENSNQQKTRSLTEVKERLTEGKVLLVQRSTELGLPEVDYKSVTSINKAMKTVSEKIHDFNSKIENGEMGEATIARTQERIEELNKINDFLRSRKNIASKGNDGKRSLRRLDDEELTEQADVARTWLDEKHPDLNLNNRGSVDQTSKQLKEELSELIADRDFADSRRSAEATQEIEDVIRALHFLDDWNGQFQRGTEELENLSTNVRQWLDDSDGSLDIDNQDQLLGRLEFLRDLMNDETGSASIEGYNRTHIESAMNFIESRLEALSGNRLNTSVEQRDATRAEIEAKRSEIEKENHLLFLAQSFGNQIKKISDKLAKGSVKAYRNGIRKARKLDKSLSETGLQKNFLRQSGHTVKDLEEGRTVVSNLGGSPATDYVKLTKGRSVKQWDQNKGGKTGHIYYIQNEDGTVDHFIVNARPTHPKGGIDDSIPPTRFIEIDGELRLNPYYRFISPNELTSSTGSLQRVQAVTDVPDPRPELSGVVVKVSEGGEDFANVQRSLDGTTHPKMSEVDAMDTTDLARGNFDAIKFRHNGEFYYKLVARDQVLDAGAPKNRDLLDTTKIETENPTASYEARGKNAKSLTQTEKGSKDVPQRLLRDEGDEEYGRINTDANEVIHKAWNDRGNVHSSEFGGEHVRFGNRMFELITNDEGRVTAWEGDENNIVSGTREDVLRELSFLDRGQKQIESERIITDLRDIGIQDERIERKLRSLEFEKEVDGNTKEYDPKRQNVDMDDAEIGDWISVERNGKLVNAKIVGKDKHNVTYRPVNKHGLLGKKVTKETHTGFSSKKFHTPFSMKTAGLGISAIAGAGTLDLDLEDFDVDEAGTLTSMMLAGLVLGTLRKGYTAYRRMPRLTQAGNKGFSPEGQVQRTIDYNDTAHTIEELRSQGIYATPKDKNFREFTRSMKAVITNKEGRDEVIDAILHNKYFQSTLSMANSSGSKTMKEFADILTDMPKNIEILRSRFEREFNVKHGSNAFKTLMREGYSKIEDLVPKLYRDGDQLHEMKRKDHQHSAKEHFNLALWRLMNSKLVNDLDEGTWRIDESTKGVDEMYDGNLGQVHRDIDERFLQDEEMMDAVQSMRAQFKAIEFEWKDALMRFERDAIVTTYLSPEARTVRGKNGQYEFTEAQYASMVDDFFLGFDGTWREYINAHDNPIVRKVLRNALKHDKGVQRLNTIRNARVKFTEGLGEKYFPQMISRTKVGKLKDGKTEEQFEQELRRSIMDLNEDNDAVRKFDSDTGRMELMQFKSEGDAINHIQHMLVGRGVPENARLAFEREFGALHGEQEGHSHTIAEKLKRAGVLQEENVEINKGNGKTEIAKRYTIANSDDLKLPYKADDGTIEEYDIVTLSNSKGLETMYDKLITGNFVKNSNFLENPREFNISNRYLETDPEQILDRYSKDVGFRLQMAKNGVFDEKSLDAEYWKPITNELNEAGVKNPSTHLHRLQTAYHTIGNIVPELVNQSDKKAFLEKKLRNRQMSEGYRNMLYGMYAQTIALYDTIQPLVSTAQYTSFSSTFKAYRELGFNNQRLQNLQNVSEEYGVIRRQMEAMLADFDDSARFSVDSSDGVGSTIGYGNAFARKYQRFWTERFDFTNVLPEQFKVTKALKDNAFTRLTMGNMINKNQVNLPLNWLAHLYEANDIAGKLRAISGGEEIRGVNANELYHKLELMGIPRDKADFFAENIDVVNQRLELAKNNGERLTSNDMDPEIEEMIQTVIHRATETYHGKNMMFRPDGFHSDGARAMTTFMNFSFNQALQITKRRFIDPIQNFRNAHPEQSSKLSLAKWVTMSRFKSPEKRTKYLKDQGFSDQAIADLPLQSVDAVMRMAMSTGISKSFYFTLDGLLALMSVGILEGAFGWEADRSHRTLDDMGYDGMTGSVDLSEVVLNPNANQRDQFRIGDIDDPMAVRDFADTFNYMLAWGTAVEDEALNIGLAGPLVGNAVQWGDPSPAGLSMGINIFEDVVNFGKNVGPHMADQDNRPRTAYNVARTFIAPLRMFEDASYVRD